jgi:Nucleotidyltransferase of unknown function (DUF6036)
MKKRELEIALRAASRVARETEFFVIGTQAIHAYCPHPPAEVLLSQECDLYPKNRPETASLLDAELGRASRFARRHGFYIDVVAPEIATLPDGWESRLRAFRIGKTTAFCLEVYDLIITKLAAGRLKDLEFVGALISLDMVHLSVLRRRTSRLDLARDRADVRSRLKVVLHDLRA